ncbi:MAG: hypothetical protein OEV40_23890 [Acidimicrobiia bacterium]|nr:hypothetical protein [Acidimicrobiia bacterium]
MAHPSDAAPLRPVPASPSLQASASRFAVFDACPHCDAPMAPEHAHYRCTGCGWRDSCCD